MCVDFIIIIFKCNLRNNFLPSRVFIVTELKVHVDVLFQEWSKRIVNDVTVPKDMTRVPQPEFECECDLDAQKRREEL